MNLLRNTPACFHRVMTTLAVLGMAGAIAQGGDDDPGSGTSPPPWLIQASAEAVLPQVIREVTQRVNPSLVILETWGATEVVPEAAAGGRRAAIQGLAGPGEAPTTGLILSEQGHLLTSLYNLSHNPAVIMVTLHDGSRYQAKVLGRDRQRQVAMLKIEVPPKAALQKPTLLEPEAVRLGQWVVALGLGYGREQPTVSLGIVSAKGRLGGLAIQTDAGISPVNYGGVLADVEGRIIGLCTPAALQSLPGMQTAQWYDAGVGFAIPLAGEAATRWLFQLQSGPSIEPQETD